LGNGRKNHYINGRGTERPQEGLRGVFQRPLVRPATPPPPPPPLPNPCFLRGLCPLPH
jgi:hypothetical protein